jgi:hypothetical protein
MPDLFVVGLIVGFGLCLIGVVVPILEFGYWRQQKP